MQPAWENKDEREMDKQKGVWDWRRDFEDLRNCKECMSKEECPIKKEKPEVELESICFDLAQIICNGARGKYQTTQEGQAGSFDYGDYGMSAGYGIGKIIVSVLVSVASTVVFWVWIIPWLDRLFP